MGYLEQILHLPYAYAWLPGLVFFVVVGAVYWLTRSTPQLAAEPTLECDSGLKSVKTPHAAEQRGTFRRHGNPVEVYIGTPEDKKNPDIGSVLDRSMGGMRLALYHEVEIGMIVSIRPVHADDIVPWVDLEIRSCRPSVEMPNQYEVGCSYVKSPPYSIQLLFG